MFFFNFCVISSLILNVLTQLQENLLFYATPFNLIDYLVALHTLSLAIDVTNAPTNRRAAIKQTRAFKRCSQAVTPPHHPPGCS